MKPRQAIPRPSKSLLRSTLWLHKTVRQSQASQSVWGQRKVLLAWEDRKDQMFPCSENQPYSPLLPTALSIEKTQGQGESAPYSVAAALGSPGLDPECVSSGPSSVAVPGIGHLPPVLCPVELPRGHSGFVAEVTLLLHFGNWFLSVAC